MKSFLRWTGIGLAFAVGFAIFLLGSFLVKPQWFLNTGTLHWAARLWLPEEVDLPLRHLSLEVESRSLFRKRLTLAAGDFCVSGEEGEYRVCGEHADLVVDLDFSAPTRPLQRIETLSLAKLDARFLPRPSPEAARPQQEEGPWLGGALEGFEVPGVLKDVTLGRLDVGLSEAVLTLPEGRLHAQGTLRCDTDEGPLACRLSFDERSAKVPFRHSAEISGSLRSVEGAPLKPSGAELAITVRAPGRGDLKANLELSRPDPEAWDLKLSGSLDSRTDGFPKLRISDCTLRAEPGDGPYPRSARFDCGIRASGERFMARTGVPVTLGGPVTAKIGAKFAQAAGPAGDADLSMRVDMKTEKGRGIQAEGWVESELHGPARELFARLPGDVSCQLKADRVTFMQVKTLLALGELTVPAPLDSLRGHLRLRSDCDPGGSPKAGLSLRVAATSKLASPNQVFAFTHKGVFKVVPGPAGTKMSLESDVTFDDVQLQLPRIDPQSIPRFFQKADVVRVADGATEAPAEPPGSFTYRVKVSAPVRPIRLKSAFTSSPILVTPTMVLASGRPLDGRIRIDSAQIELFKRKALVSPLQLVFVPGQESPGLDGRVVVRYPDYVVEILLSGTTAAPIVNMQSVPPLPPDEVVSVLLFGAPSSETNLEDSARADSTQALLVSRSVNLLSLYLLASTPVRRIDYNPDSKRLAAQVPVSDETTLTVGTSVGKETTEGSVGLRRRLTPSLSIATEVESATDGGGSSASAWLEWARRY